MAGLNGLICINKPQNFTSFDVVAKMRGIAKTKKIGHAGTLDPMATGVLPLFFGNATKACSLMPNDTKHYTADFQLGLTTDTDDIWGTELARAPSTVSRGELLETLAAFRGEILQIPPMYSAVRVGGQRLYDLARQGKTVERQPRPVVVMELELIDFDEEKQAGRLEIFCSKGTYIRAICRDLGETLGCGCVMSGLVRTKAGGFTLDDCITLEQAEELAERDALSGAVLPVERLFEHLPQIRLGSAQSRMFANGLRLDLNRINYQNADGFHAVYNDQNEFMGLASLGLEKMELVIEKMFMERK